MEAVKTLVAFDARNNPDNKGKETPLDIALKYQINDGDKAAQGSWGTRKYWIETGNHPALKRCILKS